MDQMFKKRHKFMVDIRKKKTQNFFNLKRGISQLDNENTNGPNIQITNSENNQLKYQDEERSEQINEFVFALRNIYLQNDLSKQIINFQNLIYSIKKNRTQFNNFLKSNQIDLQIYFNIVPYFQDDQKLTLITIKLLYQILSTYHEIQKELDNQIIENISNSLQKIPFRQSQIQNKVKFIKQIIKCYTCLIGINSNFKFFLLNNEIISHIRYSIQCHPDIRHKYLEFIVQFITYYLIHENEQNESILQEKYKVQLLLGFDLILQISDQYMKKQIKSSTQIDFLNNLMNNNTNEDIEEKSMQSTNIKINLIFDQKFIQQKQLIILEKIQQIICFSIMAIQEAFQLNPEANNDEQIEFTHDLKDLFVKKILDLKFHQLLFKACFTKNPQINWRAIDIISDMTLQSDEFLKAKLLIYRFQSMMDYLKISNNLKQMNLNFHVEFQIL